MTEHSDPDLLDLDDLPDTATLADPAIAGLAKGVRGLARWAKRAHVERRELRGLARWVIASVVSGALGMVLTIVGAAMYLGARMERIEALSERVERLEERQWSDRESATYTSRHRPGEEE